MRFAPRISTGAQLTIAIIVVIGASWVVSSGISSYITYQRIRALRQEMLSRPDLYPAPIPEPEFGIADLILGPRPRLGPPPQPQPVPPTPPRPLAPNRPLPGPPQGPPPGIPPGPRPAMPPDPGRSVDFAELAFRGGIAMLMALVVGRWLSGRFSRRLDALAKGAGAFNSGDFGYRIPGKGEDEFGQVAEAMNQMAERVSGQISTLEQEAERRRQFLADVAHELRSPVATMRMMAGALEDGVADDPERRSRAIRSLASSSERLLHLVEDLMELARLDLNELPIHLRQVDLRELAASVVDSHAAAATAENVTLHPVDPGNAIIARIDPDRISQVLHNLIDNAISHAGEGAEVRVGVNEGHADVTIVVSDNGRGIPATHLPRVFDPFYRADVARTPSGGHSGLGLRISRGLVEAHGGELTLTSEEDAGVTLKITLPRSRG